jgi:hypothetical protein
VADVKVRYYTIRRRGRRVHGYWQPNAYLRKHGFVLVPCGLDGPAAWAIAEEWNRRADALRDGGTAKGWPAGSIGAAFDAYRDLGAWREKKPRTREDWFRGWRYIKPAFADMRHAAVTLPILDKWYFGIVEDAGVHEAFRAMKIWRALWQAAASLKYCDKDADPSLGIRRVTPPKRQAFWQEHEVVRLVKAAIRGGYHGLACIIAVAWDTALSPVDVRTLTFGQIRHSGPLVAFEVDRAKTGRAALGTLSARTTRLVQAYIASLPGEPLPTAVIFRHREGLPYTKDRLANNFRMIRPAGDLRRLADMRRSAAVEAIDGGATNEALASKLANQLNTNEEIRQTYVPVNEPAVRSADVARLIGRRARRRVPK